MRAVKHDVGATSEHTQLQLPAPMRDIDEMIDCLHTRCTHTRPLIASRVDAAIQGHTPAANYCTACPLIQNVFSLNPIRENSLYVSRERSRNVSYM